MTDSRSSSGSRGPFAWRCNDEYYPHIFGLVTDRQVTVDAWRAGGIKFEALYSADSASSPTPQIAGGVREAIKAALAAKRQEVNFPIYGDHKGDWVRLTDDQIADVFAALSPQAQAGETKSAPAPGWLAPRLDKAADRAAAMPAWLTRDELIGIIDRASGGYNPMRNAVADAILNVAQGAVICGEPVAWLGEYDGGVSVTMNRDTMAQWKDTLGRRITPLYASPPAALPAETVTVPLEALRNCGCPADFRGTIGQCEDSGQCGCSINLKGRAVSSTDREAGK